MLRCLQQLLAHGRELVLKQGNPAINAKIKCFKIFLWIRLIAISRAKLLILRYCNDCDLFVCLVYGDQQGNR